MLIRRLCTIEESRNRKERDSLESSGTAIKRRVVEQVQSYPENIVSDPKVGSILKPRECPDDIDEVEVVGEVPVELPHNAGAVGVLPRCKFGVYDIEQVRSSLRV